MKVITVDDCIKLQKKFNKYAETAEQHEFVLLAMIQFKLDPSIEKIIKDNKVENQKEARAMFRVVLKAIGEDYSDYLEDEAKNG